MKPILYFIFFTLLCVYLPLATIIPEQAKPRFEIIELSEWDFPARYNPWGKLNIKLKPNFLTEFKLRDLRDEYKECRSILDEAGIEYRSLPDQTVASCPLENRVVLDQSKYPYSATVAPTCQMAAAIAMWEDHVVTKAAEKFLDSAIKRIQHVGVLPAAILQAHQDAASTPMQTPLISKGSSLKTGRQFL